MGTWLLRRHVSIHDILSLPHPWSSELPIYFSINSFSAYACKTWRTLEAKIRTHSNFLQILKRKKYKDTRESMLREQRVKGLFKDWGDLPGGPVVKILPSNAGRASLIPGQGAHMPHVRKNQNTERIVTNSVRTLNMVHVKKSLKKKKGLRMNNTTEMKSLLMKAFERINTNFVSTTVAKMLPHSISCYREIIHERKNQLMWQTSSLSYFEEWPRPSQPLTTATPISQQSSTLRQDPPPAKRLQLPEASDDA